MALKRLPDPVRRAPDVTEYLLQHGSLEDGSPTLTALELVMPQYLASWHEGQPLRGAPFRNAAEYTHWQTRTRQIWDAPSLKLLSEEHLERTFNELDEALKAADIGLLPHPDRLNKDAAVARAIQPRATLGPYHLIRFPTTIVCPNCGEHIGGELDLFWHRGYDEWRFICDVTGNEYAVDSTPWQQTTWDNLYNWGDSWSEQVISTPFSPTGSDWKRAKRLLIHALEIRTDILPEKKHSLGFTVRTVRLTESLGRWGDTLWRVYFRREGRVISNITPIGNTVPLQLLSGTAKEPRLTE